MQDLIHMIREAAPFAVSFMLVGGLGMWLLVSIMRRRLAFLPLYLAGALYVGFLLHGTVVSRLKSWEELLFWELPDFSKVWWNFELGARTQITAMHAVLNMALFVPWGFLGMCGQRKAGNGFFVLISGILMSAGIEFFQVCHGMVFDLGDLLTNSLGTAAGCVAGIPIALINGWVYNRRKYRRNRK